MSLNKQIQQILQKEPIQFTSKQDQNNFILKKLNISFLCYLLTESKNYFFEYEIKNNFIFINKIKKQNEEIFNINSFANTFKFIGKQYAEKNRRKIQLEKLAEVIQKESGITIKFKKSNLCLELTKFVDKNNEEIDLKQNFNEDDAGLIPADEMTDFEGESAGYEEGDLDGFEVGDINEDGEDFTDFAGFGFSEDDDF